MRLFRGSNIQILIENFEGSFLKNNANNYSQVSLTPIVELALKRYANDSARRDLNPLLLDFDVPNERLFYSLDKGRENPYSNRDDIEKQLKKAEKMAENGETVVYREFKNWKKHKDDKWNAPFVGVKYLENIYIITDESQTKSFEKLRKNSKRAKISGNPKNLKRLIEKIS